MNVTTPVILAVPPDVLDAAVVLASRDVRLDRTPNEKFMDALTWLRAREAEWGPKQ